MRSRSPVSRRRRGCRRSPRAATNPSSGRRWPTGSSTSTRCARAPAFPPPAALPPSRRWNCRGPSSAPSPARCDVGSADHLAVVYFTVLPRHLYVHVPFCARRCSYCDFSIAVRATVPVHDYVGGISRELSIRFHESGTWEVDTLYFGGGTPSKLGDAGVAALMDAIRAR